MVGVRVVQVGLDTPPVEVISFYGVGFRRWGELERDSWQVRRMTVELGEYTERVDYPGTNWGSSHWVDYAEGHRYR